MTATTSDAAAPAAADPPPSSDFSLVRGGPTYQVLRRVRLSDDALGLVHRRIFIAIVILWAPLFVLSDLSPAPSARPFIEDVGFQLRFLVVVPLLIVSELLVHLRLKPIVDQFRVRGLVLPEDRPRFEAALEQALRWRNARLPEFLLIGLVFVLGAVFTQQRYQEAGTVGWYAAPGGRLSPAGLWLVFVSLPLLQFLLLRWYYRLVLWAVFLWRLSRLRLDLDVTHPDKAGGLAFLGESLLAFTPLAAAHGVLFAGLIANHIAYLGQKLADFKFEIVGAASLLLALLVGPLLVFVPVMADVKRNGLRAYGLIGQEHSRQFRDKWLRGGAEPGELLVGNPDISSLADMGGSIGTAMDMRIVPVRLSILFYGAAAFLLPIAPLLLTVMSPDALLDRIVGMVF